MQSCRSGFFVGSGRNNQCIDETTLIKKDYDHITSILQYFKLVHEMIIITIIMITDNDNDNDNDDDDDNNNDNNNNNN